MTKQRPNSKMIPERQPHQLVQEERGQRCQICGQLYKDKPDSLCAMARRYEYSEWPEGLRTFSQLQQEHLRPGAPPAGYYVRRKAPYKIYLYEIDKAIEKKATPAQLAALGKAHAARRKKHTCKQCGRFDESYGQSRHGGGRINAAGYCSACQYEINHEATRERIQQWAYNYIADGDFIVLDSETTGLFGDHEIIELSIISGQTGNVLFSSLIQTQERRYAGDLAEHIHGISQEMLDTAPRFPDVWPTIQAILRRYRRVLVYNAAFDSQMLQQTAARYGYRVPRLKGQHWTCLMEEYAVWWGAWSSWHHSYTWQKLGAAYQQLTKHKYDGQAHRATADCMQTLEVLRELAARTSAEKIAEIRAHEAAIRKASEEAEARYLAEMGLDDHPF